MVGAPFEGSWDSVAGAAYYKQALWLTRKRALT